MGERVTRSRARDLARAKGLRNALERGTLPEFIPPEISNPAAKLPNPSWQFLDSNSESTNHANLDVRRQYLEQIFQNSFDPVIIVDKSFHIEYVNAAFEQMFGFTAADTRGQSIDDLVFPADRAAEAQWIAQCLQRGEKLTLETQRRRKDGSLLDVSVSSAPLFSDGKVRAFYAVYRDISERKRAEALSSALYRIAEKSSATKDLQQFFAAVHAIVDELTPARNFAIAIHDPESGLLSFPYFVDEHESAPAPRKLSRGLIEYVLHTGDSLLCTPDLARQLQRNGEVEIGIEPSEAVPPQWLGIPLKVN
ncbi:MAG: PAS domain S-box protein, partial [Candidatus Sulfotelmatobacter sp.]